MTYTFDRILTLRNYEKYASTYNLINKDGDAKVIFEKINLLKKQNGFQSTRIYCEHGIGFIKGDTLIEQKVYSLVITFLIEDGMWKFNAIKLSLGNQKLKKYLDLMDLRIKKYE